MASATGIDYAPYEGPTDTLNVLTGNLDLTFRPVEDDRVLLWDVLKAVTTPAGNLFWAPTATLSIPDELNATSSAANRAALQARVEAQFFDDPRMDVTCSIEFGAAGLLTATLSVYADGSGATYTATIDSDGNLALETA